jgi:hypothetical protein
MKTLEAVIVSILCLGAAVGINNNEKEYKPRPGDICSIPYEGMTVSYIEGKPNADSTAKLNELYFSTNGTQFLARDVEGAEPYYHEGFMDFEEIITLDSTGAKRIFEKTDTTSKPLFRKCNSMYNHIRSMIQGGFIYAIE